MKNENNTNDAIEIIKSNLKCAAYKYKIAHGKYIAFCDSRNSSLNPYKAIGKPATKALEELGFVLFPA